ncbi:MAG: hypothetical protein HQM14_13320 [SAR324 cluster bacterium]|nr:hypothetical protein [SAR324 cluster bacterium]
MQTQELSLEFDVEEFPEMTSEIRQWIAHVMGGAVIVDNKVDPQEIEYVNQIFDKFGEQQQMQETFQQVIQTQHPITIPPIEMPAKLSELVFRCVLRLCISDRHLNAKEVHYIQTVSNVLKMETATKRSMIKQAIFQSKEKFFKHLLARLEKQERYWLAAMILKIIYADGKVHQKELPYLNHVAELLADSPELIKSVKKDAANYSLADFDKICLPAEIIPDLLEYLLRITMSDQTFDLNELELLYEIAKTLEFDELLLDELITSVKSDHQFLFT